MGLFRRRTRPAAPAVEVRQTGGPGGWDLDRLAAALAGVPITAGGVLAGAVSAAEECAVGLLDRTLACAEVTAPGMWADKVTIDLLSATARGMLTRGDQAIWLTVQQGMPVLTPVWHQFVPGPANSPPDRMWIDYPSPGGSRQIVSTLADVALPKWSVDPLAPWTGVSPFRNSTVRIAGAVADLLEREAKNSPHGYILSGSTTSDKQTPGTPDETRDMKMSMLDALGAPRSLTAQPVPPEQYGGLFALPTGDGFIGRSENKRGEQTRFGLEPPATVIALAEWASTQTLLAAGVPPNLWEPNLEPGRDAWRRYVATTAQPVADKIGAELSRVCEVPIRIDLSPARQSDEIMSRARAARSLSDAGIAPLDALKIAGLDVDGYDVNVAPGSNPAMAEPGGTADVGGAGRR